MDDMAAKNEKIPTNTNESKFIDLGERGRYCFANKLNNYLKEILLK